MSPEPRNHARELMGGVRKGEDPLLERETKRKEIKVSELIDQWEKEKPVGRKSGKPMADRTRTLTLARLRHHIVPLIGSKRVRYHARHAVATIALSNGHDVASVAAIMGHKGPRTTLSTYAHVVDERAAQAAEQVGAHIDIAIKKKASPKVVSLAGKRQK